MIACHHYTPKHLDSRFRTACEEISRCISSMIRCAHAEDERRALVAGMSFQRALEEQLLTPEWIRSIAENEQELREQLEVDGMILLFDSEQFNFGICPSQSAFNSIGGNWEMSPVPEETYARSVSGILPESAESRSTDV